MNYALLAELYASLDQTSRRLEKTSLLAAWLPQVKENELPHVMLLLQGRVFPSYDARNIGVADKLIVKAIILASGVTQDQIEKSWKRTGDLGQSAQEILEKKKQHSLFHEELTTEKVFRNLQKLAAMEGQGTVELKSKLIAELLTSGSAFEAKFIVRTVLQDLRIGLGEGTLRDALAWAYLAKDLNMRYDADEKTITLNEKERESYDAIITKVQDAIDIANDFGIVAASLKEHGIRKLGAITLEPGRPVKVMLAQKAKTIAEGFKSVGLPCQLEYKYDGFRMEIHCWKDEGKAGRRQVRLFTRRLEDVTEQFKEVVERVLGHVHATSFILDAEAVGIDLQTGRYRPFQEISQRIRRKYDIEKLAQELPVELNVFDILYHDGKSMLAEPFRKRRQLIERIVDTKKKSILPATSILAQDEQEAERFYKKSLDAGNEGMMLKNLDGIYKPGSRVGSMVKLKPILDPLDLYIVGAEWGEGKRSAWLASFTLACRDDETGELLEIGKVGTGIKEIEGEKEEKDSEEEKGKGGEQGKEGKKAEEEGKSKKKSKKDEDANEEGDGADGAVTFDQLTRLLKPLIISEKGKEVRVKPKILVEVAYEEIQTSPSYSSGYALRFPRVLRLREDKDDASDMAQVRKIFEEQ